MKIVHVLLTHDFAGSERYAVELANAQAARHEVTMILHRRAAESRPDAIAHRLVPAVRTLFVGGWAPLATWSAGKLLERLPVEVAHAHLSAACRALHGLRGRFLRVATLHIRYKRQQHAGLDALIAITPWQLDEIPAEQRASASQIDNWTCAGSADLAARQRIRAMLGLDDGHFLIGALGRAEHSKGLDVLIDAFKRVRSPQARLAIVGHGRDWQALRRRAPATVAMPGFVERPQDWFSAFDAFVSSARSEPFGLVFLEAMASGLPVRATASQGAQHLEAWLGGPLLPTDDVAAMARALDDLAEQRPARRVYDLSAFALDTQCRAIESFYASGLQRLGLQQDAA